MLKEAEYANKTKEELERLMEERKKELIKSQ
jgi:hypothetical protein